MTTQNDITPRKLVFDPDGEIFAQKKCIFFFPRHEKLVEYILTLTTYPTSMPLCSVCSLPWESNGGFFQGLPQGFFKGGATMVEFDFTHSKLREQPVFAKNFIGKYQFQNPGGTRSP